MARGAGFVAGRVAASFAFVCAALLPSASPALSQVRSAIALPTAGGTPWSTAEIARLGGDLDAMLATAPALHGAHVGVYAIDTASNAVLYARAPDDEFQPASTLKLLVGSAALDRLGGSFRFRTTLGIESDSRYAPSLVLHGGGDPTLATADLANAVGSLPVTALSRQTQVFVDDSAFDAKPYPDGWTWDDFAQDYAPRISAVTLDENVVSLRVSPGARAGDAADVQFADGRQPSGLIEGCNAALGTTVRVVSRATTGARGTADTIDVSRNPSGCPQVVGSIPLGAAAQSVAAAVYDPLVAAAETLRAKLDERKGVVASASAFVSPVPLESIDSVDERLRPFRPLGTERIVWTHDSQSLAELLGPRFWIPSDNLFGELLLKELGLIAGGKPGTTGKGVAYEKLWLRSIGVDPATVTLADGCGMSQYDRITPRDLVAILQHDWNGPNRRLVLDSLPVGGARGTIEGLAGTPAAGRVFAKTGSMMHVRGLAGYLATVRHGAVTFAFNVDDWNGAYPALAALRAAVLVRIAGD